MFDTISYIVLLCLCCALCLTPSTVEFAVLEWFILVFFVGRLLAVLEQFVWNIRRRLKQGKDKKRAIGRAFKMYFG